MNELEYKVAMPANIILDVTNFGYIKASHMFNLLLEDKNIRKLNDNVTESIKNLLVNNRRIKSAKYDMLMNDVILYLGEEVNDKDRN